MIMKIGEKEINFLQNEGWKERQEGTRLSRKNVKPCTYLYNTYIIRKKPQEKITYLSKGEGGDMYLSTQIFWIITLSVCVHSSELRGLCLMK